MLKSEYLKTSTPHLQGDEIHEREIHNQVVFWNALRQAGVRAPVYGYGRVFTTLNSGGI